MKQYTVTWFDGNLDQHSVCYEADSADEARSRAYEILGEHYGVSAAYMEDGITGATSWIVDQLAEDET